MRKNIIVIAPHPDDETLGCGGTIIKHIAGGDRLYWLIATAADSAAGYDAAWAKRRQTEIEAVSKAYGFKGVFQLGYSAAKLDAVPKADIVRAIESILRQTEPAVVYAPFRYDAHSDHSVVFDSLISAAKTFRAPFVERILSYETVSETEFAPPIKDRAFTPNSYSDISRHLAGKIKIMRIYKSEMKKHPFPRSENNLKALATFRGATAGVKYAEAFMVIRERW